MQGRAGAKGCLNANCLAKRVLAREGMRWGNVIHSVSFYYGGLCFHGKWSHWRIFGLNFLNYEIEKLGTVSDYQKEERGIASLLHLGGTTVSWKN